MSHKGKAEAAAAGDELSPHRDRLRIPLLDRFHFSTTVRVRLPETDAFGIVFHGHFFTYFDVARMDYLRNLGMVDFIRPIAGQTNAIVHASADFRSPVRYDDELVVHGRISEIGVTSLTFEFAIVHRRENRLVAHGKTVHVILDEKSWRPVPVPEEFRAAVRRFEGSALVERSPGTRSDA